jgi:hypothetical protein
MRLKLRYDSATEIQMATLDPIEIGHVRQMPPLFKPEFLENSDTVRIDVEKNREQRF